MAKPGKLTPKQEHFAQVYVQTSNASEAYRRACDVGEGTKPESVHQAACHMLADIKVASRVMELQEVSRDKHEITVKSITDMYQSAYKVGADTENSSGMSTAATGMAKLHGLVIDRSVTKSTVSVTTEESISKDIGDMFGDK